MSCIYVAKNPSIPSVVKIGYTDRSVSERIAELNSAAGVLNKYCSIYSYEIDNAHTIEGIIHKELKQFRQGKEFFSLQENVAVICVRLICDRERTRREHICVGTEANTMKDIGCCIRAARKNQKLTQIRLAEKANILPKTISAIECFRESTSISSLLKVVKAIGGSLELRVLNV
jgi:DNA-binding XRE family transcriptional regulator